MLLICPDKSTCGDDDCPHREPHEKEYSCGYGYCDVLDKTIYCIPYTPSNETSQVGLTDSLVETSVADKVAYKPKKERKEMKKSMIENMKAAATKTIKAQPELAKTAILLEGSDLLLTKAVSIIKPKLPLFARGYADTPAFKAVVANLVMVAVETARPDTDAETDVYKQIANAGAVKAYSDVIGSFNLGDMIEELFADKKMQSLIGKIEKSPKVKKAAEPAGE